MHIATPLLITLAALLDNCQAACSPEFPVWSTANGNLLVNGEVFHLKGVSWFGFETDYRAPHGLWGPTSIPATIQFFKDNNFNAVRLPFSVQWTLDDSLDIGYVDPSNRDVVGKKPLELYSYVVDKLGEAGILVLIDQHTLKTSITELPTGEGYSKADIERSWRRLLGRVGNKWNVMGVDIKNEPHGPASWGTGNDGTDWDTFATNMIRTIHHTGLKGLYLVEGVGNGRVDSPWASYSDAHFWGGNLEGVYRHPIVTGDEEVDNRIVYSPHVYGPDVSMQSYFDSSFSKLRPLNEAGVWFRHFGFVEGRTGRPVVIGEWGGKYGGGHNLDRGWQDALSQYLRDHCLADQFYWCFNPNSGSTHLNTQGGL